MQNFRLVLTLILHETVMFGSFEVGSAGSQVSQAPNLLFQYQPSFRLQRHFVRRFPVARYPGLHLRAHVAPSHLGPSSWIPGIDDVSKGGQSDQWRDSPSPFTFPLPTGAPQPPPDLRAQEA